MSIVTANPAVRPVVLGAGERLVDALAGPALTPTEVLASPTVTHPRHRTAPQEPAI